MALGSILGFWGCKFFEKKGPTPFPKGFDWQGHRGCRGWLPENTIPAFLGALEYPEIQTLELDLAVSKDKQLIVSHEPWFSSAICLKPTRDTFSEAEEKRFRIMDMTAAEIRNWDCGSRGNPRFPKQKKMKAYKPTLREVVLAVRAKYPNRNPFYNIEIKSAPEYDGIFAPPPSEFAQLVYDELKALDLLEKANVQSFDERPLQALRKIDPALRLALLVENVRGFSKNIEKLGFNPDIYSPYYLLVNKKLVRKCHNHHIKLIPWTVNDSASAKRLLRLGVDGIITDYPGLWQ